MYPRLSNARSDFFIYKLTFSLHRRPLLSTAVKAGRLVIYNYRPVRQSQTVFSPPLRPHSHLSFASRLTWIYVGSDIDIVVSVILQGSFSEGPSLLVCQWSLKRDAGGLTFLWYVLQTVVCIPCSTIYPLSLYLALGCESDTAEYRNWDHFVKVLTGSLMGDDCWV